MKPLLVIGLIVLVFGIASLFVPIPHSKTHGIKSGDVKIAVTKTEHERLSPAISAVIIVAGVGLIWAGRRS